MTTISVTDFKKRVGSFIDEPLTEPVYLTKKGRKILALINAVDLEQIISAADNRQCYFIRDLPADAIAALEKGPQTLSRPELDHLMKDR